MLKKVWVSGKQLEISRMDSDSEDIRLHEKRRAKKAKKKSRQKGR
jgi:hypothetical protein